jgi:hypothetical protein
MLTWDRIQCIGSEPIERLNPARARRALAALQGVGRWIVKPEVIQCARMETEGLGESSIPPAAWSQPPRLGGSVGECWVMLVNKEAETTPLLRPCFILPLQWCEDVDHSRLLPEGLIDLADQVIGALDKEQRVKDRRWGLRPLPLSGFDRCDLVDVRMDCPSAWAALAAGLILAADEIRPDPEVWATGEWVKGTGMVEVGGLELKLDLADALGARTFFVPHGQKELAEGWRASRNATLAVQSFDHNKPSNIRPAIREYLARSSARPGAGSSFEVRQRYYQIQTDTNRRRRYYVEDLLPDLADYHRDQLPNDCRPTHLVTIASHSPELVVLLAKTLRPGRCLILFTDENRHFMEEAVGDIQRLVPTCESRPALFTRDNQMADSMKQHVGPDCEVISGEIRRDDRMSEDMKNNVALFMDAIDSSKVLFDLTPGTKDMSLELAMSIAPPGSYLFYLRHDFDPEGKPLPGKKPPLMHRVP